MVAALIPAPYNLTTISYNTSPNLLLLIAATAGARAAQSTDGRWAAGAGVAAVLAALCNPVMAPAAGLTLVLVVLLSRRRPVLVGMRLGVAASAGLVAAWLTAVVGIEHVRETLEFTAAYQAQRISYATRLQNAWRFYGSTFSSPAVGSRPHSPCWRAFHHSRSASARCWSLWCPSSWRRRRSVRSLRGPGRCP